MWRLRCWLTVAPNEAALGICATGYLYRVESWIRMDGSCLGLRRLDIRRHQSGTVACCQVTVATYEVGCTGNGRNELADFHRKLIGSARVRVGYGHDCTMDSVLHAAVTQANAHLRPWR